MGEATQKLMDYQGRADRFDIPWGELASTRIAALDEAFQERKDKIKLLGHRASEAGI